MWVNHADDDLMLDALGALVFWRLIAPRRSVTRGYLDRVADMICAMAKPARRRA
jgi:hypothetical protein